ncbi:MAG: 50S ribosomal protein L13 [Pseudomonadota bacterium]
MKTAVAKKETVKHDWYIVDATNQVLGRLASRIAVRLRGKHNPMYTPHLDMGDFIVVVNAEKIALTGKKWDDKIYYRHSGFMGGLKAATAKELLKKRAENLLFLAVKRMLPKNSLGRQLITKLKIYTGAQHPHAAQKPETLTL